MMNRLAGFTGLPAVIAKIAFMAIIDAFLVTMFFAATHKHSSILASVIIFFFVSANFVYFARFTLPLKFLLPGLLLLITFVVVPVVYTVSMSGFNYKTGNEISKEQAIIQLQANGLTSDANNTAYDMVLGKIDGAWAALLTNQSTGEVLFATEKSVGPVDAKQYTKDQYGIARGYPGLIPIDPQVAANDEAAISALRFPLGDGKFISPQALDVAVLLVQSYVYDKKTDSIQDLSSGAIYKDNGQGNYANVANPQEQLKPGWRAWNTFQNYTHLLTDPNVRGPFIGVFIWTITFAFTSVLTMFAVGLLLAIVLNRKIALKRFYRSVLILPYAIPSFMSILIWNGMFNRQFGAINALFHTHIDFFNSPWLAKMVILIVNLWLGFPYFYLISSGALQAIPAELEEAASLDGASTAQTLRRIKLPLLLQILSPLLIASFAFNFNNFNIIYLLTGGGPTDVLHGKQAGATDILITYTYKTAFGSNEQNLGLACAISMIIFVIVGGLSLWSLRRSKVLDSF
jgi:arabinogalactan oligomer/maltooligosaccharide transport system permease protein